MALALPPEIRHRLAEIASQLHSVAEGVRWTPCHRFHLTLKFLGEVSRPDSVIQALQALKTPPFQLTFRGVGAFPSRKRARVLWVGAESEPLTQLAQEIETRLERVGFPPEPRPFRGHLTLGRIRRLVAQPELNRKIGQMGEVCAGKMRVDQLTLFESLLQKNGSKYHVLSMFVLQGQDRDAKLG